jgi:hypothetical protein
MKRIEAYPEGFLKDLESAVRERRRQESLNLLFLDVKKDKDGRLWVLEAGGANTAFNEVIYRNLIKAQGELEFNPTGIPFVIVSERARKSNDGEEIRLYSDRLNYLHPEIAEAISRSHINRNGDNCETNHSNCVFAALKGSTNYGVVKPGSGRQEQQFPGVFPSKSGG